MAGFFPLFFKQYWSTGTSVTTSTFWLGVGNSFASLLIVLLAPLLGALADASGLHKRLLGAFALLGILATSGFFLVAEGNWPVAISLYVIAILGFSGANVFYDAMLPAIAAPADRHRLSALGFALGYLGGGLLFALNVAMTLKPQWFGLASASEAVRYSFLSVSLWWFIFSLPLLLGVKPETLVRKSDAGIGSSLRALRKTFKEMRQHRNVWMFLLAYWLYIDGVATIIRMAVDYGMAIGLPSNSLIVALLIVQFIGFPATLVFGWIGDRLTIAAVFMDSVLEFYMLAVALGLVQGGVQSLSRSLFSHLIPAEKSGEYFGLLNMLGKAAAVVGPLLVGVVAATTESSRLGLLSIIVLFLAGMWFLAKVEEPPRAPAN